MAESNPFTEPLASSAAPSAAAPAGATDSAPAGPPTGAAAAVDVNAAVAKRNAAASAGYGSVSASAAGGAVVGGAAGDDGPYTRPDPEVDGPGAAFGSKPTGGSGSEPESKAAAAPGDDRLANAVFLILAFLSWVGCWVVFTGRMAYLYTGSGIPSATCQMYWNRMECSTSVQNQPSINFHYSDCITLLTWHMTEICSACESSGKGTMALAVFAFFALTALLVLLVARVIGRSASIPWVGADAGRYLKVECGLTAWALFCFWVIVMLYRTKCMEEAQSWSHYWESSVVGTGWWYCVGVFFFLILCLIISLSYSANPWCRGRCHDTLSEQAAVTQAARAGADPTCLTGFQNSPAFATRCDAVLNVTVVVCCLLCWIGSLVAVGGELHRVTLNTYPGGTLTFNWKTFGKSGEMIAYSDDQCGNGVILTADQCNSCMTGGRGTVAVGALAFIAETAAIVFTLLRMSGKVKAKLLRGEWLLAAFSALMFVFISTVWGGTCFNSVRQGLPSGIPNTLVGTGWGYDVFCFLLSLLVTLLLWIVRHRAGDLPSLDVGGVYSTLRSEV